MTNISSAFSAPPWLKVATHGIAWGILASIAAWSMGCSTLSEHDAQSRTDKLADTAADQEKANEARAIQMMNDIIIPEISFCPPDTIIDAIEFFKQASRDFAKPDASGEQYGLSFVLKLPSTHSEAEDPFHDSDVSHSSVPVINPINARFIALYDALRLVCDITGMKFYIRNGLVIIVPRNEPEGELITRTYYTRSAWRMGNANSAMLKDFYESFGVEWPNGSSIQYLPALNKLRVTNTEDNHAKMLKTLGDLNVLSQVINIEFQIVAFKAKDIERLQSRGEEISVANLNTLRRKGKAKPVATASIVTKPGNEAVLKSVKELIYPTELTAETSDTNQGGVAVTMTPDALEMREVGVILQVLPEILDNNLINLMLNPQWIALDGWDQYEAGISTRRGLRKFPFRQPVFNSTSWITQVPMKSGETILLGGSTEPDGKWVYYAFLRATTRQIEPEVEL